MYKITLILSTTTPLVAFLLAGCGQTITKAAVAGADVGADFGAMTNNAVVGITVFVVVFLFTLMRKSR